MKRNKFEVGDVIKGKENNFPIFNEDMTKALVIEIKSSYDMVIKILNHNDKEFIDKSFVVANTTDGYELLENINKFDVSLYVKDNRLYCVDNISGKELSLPITEVINVDTLKCLITNILKYVDLDNLIDDAPRYNGKVIFINDFRDMFTKGKIYNFTNGQTTLDNGEFFPLIPAKTFDDVVKYSAVEVVEVFDD